jgi:hypothetical protein
MQQGATAAAADKGQDISHHGSQRTGSRGRYRRNARSTMGKIIRSRPNSHSVHEINPLSHNTPRMLKSIRQFRSPLSNAAELLRDCAMEELEHIKPFSLAPCGPPDTVSASYEWCKLVGQHVVLTRRSTILVQHQ